MENLIEHLHLFMTQVTSEEIVFQLLDRVTVPELVASIVDSQVRPYCDRHKLSVDVVLLNYVRVSMCGVPWRSSYVSMVFIAYVLL